MSAPSRPENSGLALLEYEMACQQSDALASLSANAEVKTRMAESIGRNRSLLLVGMGASHAANRMAEPCYRRHGVECWALTAADLLQSPLPPAQRTVLFVSQSGESGEILQLLEGLPRSDDMFGLTLDPASTLGRSLPCLVGAGGAEIAFAATRSLTITVALHAALIAAIEGGDETIAEALRSVAVPALDEALAVLGEKSATVFSGRGELRGLAEANALMLMELARMPALGYESGQFRHGPLEMLAPRVGVVLLRGPGQLGKGAAGLAAAAAGAGARPVVFDCSGEPPLADAVTVTFQARDGLAAILTMLPALQRLIIAIAGQNVVRVGEPLRSTKITGVDHEA